MRHKQKLVLLACAATLAIMIMAPIAGASASPTWKIEGTPFKGEETLKIASTGPVTLQGDLVYGGANSKITCESLGTPTPPKFGEPREEQEWYKKHSPKIVNSTEGQWEMTFTGCKFTEPGCGIASSLEGRDGPSLLADEGTNTVADKFGTDTQTFLSYTARGCAGEGIYNVKGAPRCKIVQPGIGSVIKQCEFSATSGSTLTAGGYPAVLTGTVNMELAGVNKGKKWTASF
jgi:hypothetical protein